MMNVKTSIFKPKPVMKPKSPYRSLRYKNKLNIPNIQIKPSTITKIVIPVWIINITKKTSYYSKKGVMLW